MEISNLSQVIKRDEKKREREKKRQWKIASQTKSDRAYVWTVSVLERRDVLFTSTHELANKVFVMLDNRFVYRV